MTQPDSTQINITGSYVRPGLANQGILDVCTNPDMIVCSPELMFRINKYLIADVRISHARFIPAVRRISQLSI